MEWVLIAAVAKNRVIGVNNQLPWHLPEDLKHFRELTRGATVVMGRKTWESLPDPFRPLPGRRNIVVSRQSGLVLPGSEVMDSLDAVRNSLADLDGPVFVIGGADIYTQAMAWADRLEITEVDVEPQGDAWFPKIDASWQRREQPLMHTDAGLGYRFVTYVREAN